MASDINTLARELVAFGNQNTKKQQELTDNLTKLSTSVNNFSENFKNQFVQQVQTYNLLNNRVTSLETNAATDRTNQTNSNNNLTNLVNAQTKRIDALVDRVLYLEQQNKLKDEEIRKLKATATTPISKESIDKIQTQIDQLFSNTYGLLLAPGYSSTIRTSDPKFRAYNGAYQHVTGNMRDQAFNHFNK